MFNTLEDQTKNDDRSPTAARERWFRYGIVVLLSAVVFGGLFAGIRFLE